MTNLEVRTETAWLEQEKVSSKNKNAAFLEIGF